MSEVTGLLEALQKAAAAPLGFYPVRCQRSDTVERPGRGEPYNSGDTTVNRETRFCFKGDEQLSTKEDWKSVSSRRQQGNDSPQRVLHLMTRKWQTTELGLLCYYATTLQPST